MASAGDDVIDGGDGEDAMTFSQSKGNYSITKSGDSFLVSDLTGSEGTDTISGVERFGFSDGILALDVDAGGLRVRLTDCIRRRLREHQICQVLRII